jgi:hypothetical protein
VIAEVVFVPSAPLLLAEYTGIDDAGAELRARCVETVRVALASAIEEVCVVDAVDPRRIPARGSLGWRIARQLLDEAGCTVPVAAAHVMATASVEGEIAWLGRDLASRDGRVLLLVVGDGSPRRGEKAPGHLDERSFAVDEAWVAALRSGDTAALLSLDPDLCAELLVTGRAAWQVAATAVAAGGTRCEPHLLWSGDPWGVMYAIARWSAVRV